MGGGPNQYSMPGLPLGIYTNHWHRTVNMPGSGSCKAKNTDQGGRCARATEYSADFDNDLQGLFEVSDQPFSDNFMLLWILWNAIFTTYPPNPILAHCSKSSFFCRKIQLWIPEKIVDFFWLKNSWKCWGFGLFSCWQLWFHEKNCQKILAEKFMKMLGVFFLSKLNFWTKIWLFE